MEPTVRSAWVEPAAIAHTPKHRRCQRHRGSGSRVAEAHIRPKPCPPGTEFLDAETGPPKSPPETTLDSRDPKHPKPVAQIRAETAHLTSMRNYPVQEDWMVGTTGELLRNKINALRKCEGEIGTLKHIGYSRRFPHHSSTVNRMVAGSNPARGAKRDVRRCSPASAIVRICR
jgi:hypothetical protein